MTDNIKKEIEETKYPRFSACGFYCADCRSFVYRGYDSRDKIGLPDNNAVCGPCGDSYEDVTPPTPRLAICRY